MWAAAFAGARAWHAQKSFVGTRRARIESTHVANGGLLVDLGLQILEDALVDHFGGGIW